MGKIRFLLAIAVLVEHGSSLLGLEMTGGKIAVQGFYIISGFYMALILNEKYVGKNSYSLYITNRLLRLYPIYFVVLIGSVLGCLAYGYITSGSSYLRLDPYIEYGSQIGFLEILFLIAVNITILFQDLVTFMGVDLEMGSLFFTSNFRNHKPWLVNFMIIPQAWTLSLEIMFYLIAPFLVRRKVGYLILFACLSAAIKIGLTQTGLNFDPWSYRFFPSELQFFILGALGYRIYLVQKSKTLVPPKYLPVFLVVLIAYTLGYSFLKEFALNPYLYLFCVFISVPFLFSLTKSSKRDRFIGELSYPIYIVHFSILGIVENIIIDRTSIYFTPILIVLTVIISLGLNELVAKRVEILRQKRAEKNLKTY